MHRLKHVSRPSSHLFPPQLEQRFTDRGMLIPRYIVNIPTLLWSYRVPLFSPDPVVSPPVACPLAHNSMITEHLSHERVYQALTFHCPCFTIFYVPGRSPRVFSVQQSLVEIVGPHTGAREGTIQRPARGGHSHRPSAFFSRGARHRGARRPPRGAGRHAGSQHGPHPCTGVQEASSDVRFSSPPPLFRGLHQTSIVT